MDDTFCYIVMDLFNPTLRAMLAKRTTTLRTKRLQRKERTRSEREDLT